MHKDMTVGNGSATMQGHPSSDAASSKITFEFDRGTSLPGKEKNCAMRRKNQCIAEMILTSSSPPSQHYHVYKKYGVETLNENGESLKHNDIVFLSSTD